MSLHQCGRRCAPGEDGQDLQRFRVTSELLMKWISACAHARILKFLKAHVGVEVSTRISASDAMEEQAAGMRYWAMVWPLYRAREVAPMAGAPFWSIRDLSVKTKR